MDDLLNSASSTHKSIKERYQHRFKAAIQILGPYWRKELGKSDPFFNTYEGIVWMARASECLSDPRRISVDRLERVVLAAEKSAGIGRDAI